MKIRRQSPNLVRSGENEEDVEAELGPSAKAKNLLYETSAASDALRFEAWFTHQVLGISVKQYCFVWNASFNKPEDLYGLEQGCAFSG